MVNVPLPVNVWYLKLPDVDVDPPEAEIKVAFCVP
jgi:hypothetical protein